MIITIASGQFMGGSGGISHRTFLCLYGLNDRPSNGVFPEPDQPSAALALVDRQLAPIPLAKYALDHGTNRLMSEPAAQQAIYREQEHFFK
jgi:hypothetical protein